MKRIVPKIDASAIGRNTPIRLDIAASLAFPDGSITISSLRREAKNGRLAVWRIAGKDMTSLHELDRMLERCRVQPNRLDSGSGQQPKAEKRSGSSSTEGGRSALDAALTIVKRQRESLRSTSARNTTQAA